MRKIISFNLYLGINDGFSSANYRLIKIKSHKLRLFLDALGQITERKW